jgi:alkylated DNA repair dioxygenase AlkB
LVTEYAPGAGIGWHRDKGLFDEVVGVSLLAPCAMRFRRREGVGWRRAAAPLPRRSAYLLTGAARNDWEHSIRPMDALRYSVTFRSLRQPSGHPATRPGGAGA